MCTKNEGEVIRDIFNKYLEERLVDSNDLETLEILADSARIKFINKKDGLYAVSTY